MRHVRVLGWALWAGFVAFCRELVVLGEAERMAKPAKPAAAQPKTGEGRAAV